MCFVDPPPLCVRVYACTQACTLLDDAAAAAAIKAAATKAAAAIVCVLHLSLSLSLCLSLSLSPSLSLPLRLAGTSHSLDYVHATNYVVPRCTGVCYPRTLLVTPQVKHWRMVCTECSRCCSYCRMLRISKLSSGASFSVAGKRTPRRYDQRFSQVDQVPLTLATTVELCDKQ